MVVAGIVLFEVGKSQCTPEKAAMDYFGALESQNWNSAYQKLDVGNSEFLTEKNFEAAQKKTAEDEKITNYEVLPAKQTDALTTGTSGKNTGSLSKDVTIQYLTKGSSSPKRQVFSLVKQPGKKWFLFDSWKIGTDNLVTPEVTISAPAEVTVSLGDIKLSSKYLVKDKDSDSNDSGKALVTYSVKEIFSGNYTIKATSPNTEDYTHPVNVDESASEFMVSRGDLKLKQSILDSVAKQPGEIIKALYSSALAGKDFDSVSSYFVTDRNDQDTLRDKYNDIRNLVAAGTDGGFKSIDFTSFTPEVDSSSSNTENIVVNTDVNYSYTAVPDSFFSDTPATPYNGKESSSFQMKFRNEKGKWLVADMCDFCFSCDDGYSDQN